MNCEEQNKNIVNLILIILNFISKRIVIFSILLIISNLCQGQEKSIFIKLDNSQGATHVEQDNLGYIWYSGFDGLYKYNGYDFLHTAYPDLFGGEFSAKIECLFVKDYQNSFWISTYEGELTKIDSNGLKTSYKKNLSYNSQPVQILDIDSNDKGVWLGSSYGTLYEYNYELQKIDSVTSLPKINNTPQKIRDIVLVDEMEIWLVTAKGIIYNYAIDKNEFKEFKGAYGGIEQDIKICVDKKNNLWISTELKGLFKYDCNDKRKFKQFDIYKTTNLKNLPIMFLDIFCDSYGNIWVGTDGDGLYRIDSENEKVTIFKHDETNRFSISDNTLIDINEDRYGNIWVVDKKNKINIFPNTNNEIKYFNGLDNDTPVQILSMLKSKTDESLWIGTDGKGLTRVLPNNSKLNFNVKNKGEHYFAGKYIQSLVEDVSGNIWIATYLRGLWVYDIRSKTFSQIKISGTERLHPTDIRFLFKDSKKRIWVSTVVGIYVFDHSKKMLASFNYGSKGLFGSVSQSISEDENGTIWVGVDEGGLFKLNENKESLDSSIFTILNYNSKNKKDYLNYNILDIKPDFNGNLWILCQSGFLIRYALNNNYFERFDEAIFRGKNFSAILISDPNNIWLSSKIGIHHFKLNLNTITSYYEIDGFQSGSYFNRSSYKDNNGVLYFGGEFGLNTFLPKDVVKNDNCAKLYINDIDILNKPGYSILPDQFKEKVEIINNLNLKARHSSFSFSFSAIDNVLNTNYHYAYKLTGFDNDWITSKKERVASYTNIPYGKYIFEVKAGRVNGIWDIEPRKIDITIGAPWWFSTWAFILYFLLLLYFANGIYVKVSLKNKLVKEEWQNQQEKKLYELKMNFFTKMSHEIQTPLTLILGPIDDMLNRAMVNSNELLKQRLLIIKNNAKRLSRISTTLMTVRNKELGKATRVFSSKNNIRKHLKHISLSFAEQARFKEIDLIEEYPQKDLMVWYDKDKFEHVIYNLLSNAFKFTPTEGRIIIKVSIVSYGDAIEISISDSGPGIPKDELKDIFNLFYQSKLGKQAKGFGIGLALSNELISINKGTIDVVSSPGLGTNFKVKLSTKENVFTEDEKIFVDASKILKEPLGQNIEILRSVPKNEIHISSQKLYTILIVEDNIEMQIFLRGILSKSYKILIANNGVEGIKLAEKNIPDLILSDIMMPELNGLKMSVNLQKNRKTTHIPIVLLTAKNTTRDKIEGLKSGAIEYIRKPFNSTELLLKINNIIDSKEKFLLKFKAELASSPKDDKEKNKDELFLEKLTFEINNQLENSNFKLENLSLTLNMSYSVIYRKCIEVTGMSLVEFVRSIRLKKAALLIVKLGFSVSEAAFMVGYKDPKYFTLCFKKEFGKTPISFKREAIKIDLTDFLDKYNIMIR